MLVILGLAALGFLSYRVSINRGQMDRQVSVKTLKAESELTAQRKKEASRIANENFYQKLKNGDPVSILVIGDQIAAGAGSPNDISWDGQLVTLLGKSYSSDIQVTKMTSFGSNIVSSWITYNKAQQALISQGKKESTFDCVMICTGYFDQTQLSYKEFHMFYENLIDRLIKANPRVVIIPILENCMKDANDYSANISELSKYYGLNLIDMKAAFYNDTKPYYELVQKDKLLPNNRGYSIYASQISEDIVRNVSEDKIVNYDFSAPLFESSSMLKGFQCLQTAESSGFTLSGGAYTSNRTGSSLTFTANRSVVYLEYNIAPKGGKFQVYLDDTLLSTVNTNSVAPLKRQLLISNTLNETHRIKLVALSKNAVSINGIITN